MNTLGGVVLICLGIFVMTLVVIGRAGATWAAITGAASATPPSGSLVSNGIGSLVTSGVPLAYANVDPSAGAAAAGLSSGAGAAPPNPAVPQSVLTAAGSAPFSLSATQAIARRSLALGIA
jgi:hypothetical protein